MAHISFRVSDEEKELMENYANWLGVSLSEAIKTIFFEKMEDEYDLRVIAEYEAAEKEGKIEYKTFDEVVNDLGLEDEI
ncbi:MAG: type II toxin-antitoxin system RelB family antitoxin [Dethiobacteria bacterium]|jgi:antitoxin component of RelBE/YafQ-DinJ toxin-antitoxin module